MSFALPRLSSRAFFGIGLGLGTTLLLPTLHSRRSLLYLDSSPSTGLSAKDWSFSQYSRDAKAPVVKKGQLNPKAVRQISTGSILGMSSFPSSDLERMEGQ